MIINDIKRNCNAKMKDWLNSITDKDLRNDVKQCAVLSGGAIASLLNKEEPNDYDIYLTDIDVAERLANYYLENRIKEKDIEKGYKSVVCRNYDETSNCHRIKLMLHNPDEKSEEYFETNIGLNGIPKNDVKDYDLKYISANAITLHGNVQIILRFIGNMQDVHKNFDFIHNTNYYSYQGSKLVLHNDALLSLHSKELIYRGSKYPICSMFRIRKFMERGFKISAGQMLKIAIQINELNLKDIEVLKDQLAGVDSAYFAHFLQKYNDKNDVTTVDLECLIELIDEFYDEMEEFES